MLQFSFLLQKLHHQISPRTGLLKYPEDEEYTELELAWLTQLIFLTGLPKADLSCLQ